jgi:hypothetical protein
MFEKIPIRVTEKGFPFELIMQGRGQPRRPLQLDTTPNVSGLLMGRVLRNAQIYSESLQLVCFDR